MDTDYRLVFFSLSHTHTLTFSLKDEAQKAYAYDVDRRKDVFIK